MAVTRITIQGLRLAPFAAVNDPLDDLHLLPGDRSIDMRTELRVQWEDEDPARPITVLPHFDPIAALPAGATVTFSAELAGMPHAHGVHFDAHTGVVTVDDPLGPAHVSNFLVRARVHTNLGGESHAEIVRRIYVHRRVDQVWLTPHSLTVPEGIAAPANSISFTVLARFDDGVVGDITDWPRLLPPRNHFAWSTNRADIGIDANGLMLVNTGQDGNDADVTLTYQRGADAPLHAEGVIAVRSWDAPLEIEPVGTASAPLDGRTNFLFVAEGMVFQDEEWFRLATDQIVQKLGSSDIVEPWKSAIKSGRLQFWRTFLRSAEEGITQLSEVTTPDLDGPMGSGIYLVDVPSAPPPDADEWTLPEMIHEVGLPTKALSELGEEDLRARLVELYGPKVTKRRLGKKLSAWRKLAARTIPNQCNSLFSLCKGQRPRAAPNPDFETARFDTRRMTDGFFARHLSRLRLKGGPAVGARWNFGGADDGRVGMLVRGSARSQQLPRFFTAHPEDVKNRALRAVPGPGIETRPTGLPDLTKIDPLVLATLVVHEGSHVLGLGDEYGDDDEQHHAPLPGSSFPERFPNLHSLATIQAAAPRRVSMRNVKWASWHRIRRAAVVEQVPTIGGGIATIRVAPEQLPGLFEGRPTVRLRTRIVRRDPGGSFQYVAPMVSEPLKVLTAPTADSLTLESAGLRQGTEVALASLNTFPAVDTIVYVPRRGPLGGGPEDELPLVAPVVSRHIETTGGPCDAPSGDPARACAADDTGGATQYPRNLPGHHDMPCYMQYVIGLYESGATYRCGVFHPGGICMMRRHGEKIEDDNFDDLFDSDGIFTDGDMRRFCFVCRYVLIDVLDPTMHGRFDDAYEDHYPN